MNINIFRKTWAVILCLLIFINSVPLEGISFAATTVTKVLYNTKHNRFDIQSGYLEIHGTDLKDVSIHLRNLDNELFVPKTIETQSENLILINLSAAETKIFQGQLVIGSVNIDLNIGNFPTIKSANSKNINYGNNDDLIFQGNHLDQIKDNLGDSGIIAKYGKLQKTEFFNGSSVSNVTITDPVPPGGNGGLQDVTFSRKSTISGAAVEVVYQYADVFRLVDNVGLNTPEMFPNIGAHGDQVYFTSDNFNNTKTYGVYFLKDLAGGDDFNSTNKAKFVALSLDVEGTQDKLTVKVPDKVALPADPNFTIGTYYVVIVNESDGQVVAEQTVFKPGTINTPDEYTVIESSYNPLILSVNPTAGTDTGSPVTIQGSNILEVDLPSLVDNNTITSVTTSGAATELVVKYDNGTYNGKAATIERMIKIQIGKLTTFNTADYTTGVVGEELLRVTTGAIPDAETDPNKDVQVEMTTTITEVGSGKKYVFRQTAVKESGYKFLPSTLTPEVTDLVPATVQAIQSPNPYDYKIKDDTLIVIKGDKFLVDRIVQPDGKVIVRKPTILFKKDQTDLNFDHYQVGFFPSDEVGGVTGIIRHKQIENTGSPVVLEKTAGGVTKPIQLEMTVLNKDGKVVDGTVDNNVGTKMVIKIPKEVPIQDIGVKQVHVVNPRRGSAEYGGYKMYIDKFSLVETADNPLIETVEPNVVTLDGGVKVTLTGSNLQEGMKLYLDGEEITTFTRKISPSGAKIIVEFDAPKGREGVTQIQVINPSGGTDVRDFTYVKSFNNDPKITNFTPTRGTPSTLVLVNGENYLKPDPSVGNTSGVNGFRLIGTRAFLDGKDVNEYNMLEDEIQFLAYTSPVSTDALIKFASNKAIWSPFVKNATITKNGVSADEALFYASNDAKGNPMITNKDDESYFITYNPAGSGSYLANIPGRTEAAVPVTINHTSGSNTTNISFTIDSKTLAFTGVIDNNVISQTQDADGNKYVRTADYVDSIILTNGTNYFILGKQVNGDIIFTNGSDLTYKITVDGAGFKGQQGNNSPVAVSVSNNQLTVNGLNYTYITPYVKDNTTGQITGDNTNVINTKQLSFIVPTLTTGTGYKDLAVVNPDTRRAEKTGNDGFYYISQSSSHPVISSIVPNEGSIDGGYVIKISGSEFEDNMKVFIDSVEVPKADTYVALDGSYVNVKVPKCIKDLQGDFGVDRMDVPVVVLNEDGGSASKPDGFTYVVPISNPKINQVILDNGSSNGAEIVQILGYDFRFFEPYTDVGDSGPGYNPGDKFTDLYNNNKWDDLLASDVDPNAVKNVPLPENPVFDFYKESKVLPTVYFGENKAKIVEYSKGFLKVIAPAHKEGEVDLYVVNNDQGVSNKFKYTYKASTPTIKEISPDKGNRTGQEIKDIYGAAFFRSAMKGYATDNPDTIVTLTNLEANVRFADIDNREVASGQPNHGLVNGGLSEVVLTGGLRASYNGNTKQVTLYAEENGKIYKRTFNNYDNSVVYIPMEMLRNETAAGSGVYEYYYPSGYVVTNKNQWNDNKYEYIRVSIEDRRFIVERGYAPKVQYISGTRLTVVSPSYHTIDTVPVTVTNNDGGSVKVDFTYTNPDSKPKILKVNPFKKSTDGNSFEVEASIQGGVEIEIIGTDFRDDVKAAIGAKTADIIEKTTKVIDEKTYDVLIVKVPAGTEADIDQRYPVLVENTDNGMANSTTLTDLIGPNDGTSTLPFFFVYRKPLSGPKITKVEPNETSIYGGNELVITGTDFRTGALVIIGTSGGVPVKDGVISDQGTKLTIKTPKGMTVGNKTVQVINKDFGTGTLDSAVKVVSYPTVTGEILTADGTEDMTTVNVEGGQKILIKGSGFLTGAKVYFGGTRTVVKEKPDEGVFGLFRDDTYIVLKDAYEATGVEVKDANNLIVTTPEITKEDTFVITVLNEDSGISDNNADIKFSEPVPTRPVSLKARVIDDRYIQLYDYTSDGVEYYEVYYYLGSKTTSEIGRNDRQDMKYLGTTTLEPYKVNRIPGFENRDAGDVLYFALIAVNKFGVSKWSNYATLNYKQLEDVEELGPEDIDGELGVPVNKDYTYDSDGTTSVINISSKDIPNQVTIDLRGVEEGDPQTRIINVPKEMIESNQSVILVNYLDSKLQFTPVGLNTQEFRELNFYERAYGRITSSTAGDSYNSMLKLSLPRGKKTATRIMTLDVEAINNEESKTLSKFSAPMDIQLVYDDTYLSPDQEATLQMYRFDQGLNQWELMPANVDQVGNIVTLRTEKPGSFVVLYDR